METTPRYHTTPYCSVPLFGYLLQIGDVLQEGDRHGGTYPDGQWHPCQVAGLALACESSNWVRPCPEPASERTPLQELAEDLERRAEASLAAARLAHDAPRVMASLNGEARAYQIAAELVRAEDARLRAAGETP